MPTVAQLKKTGSSRVECCGPHGPEHLIVSWITADKEQWVVFPKVCHFPDECHARRSFLGWCRACADAFKVQR